jgi:hypothetical protein
MPNTNPAVPSAQPQDKTNMAIEPLPGQPAIVDNGKLQRPQYQLPSDKTPAQKHQETQHAALYEAWGQARPTVDEISANAARAAKRRPQGADHVVKQNGKVIGHMIGGKNGLYVPLPSKSA